MSEIIEDGTGQGYKAKINSKNRMLVSAENKPVMAIVSGEDGEAYVFASGDFISITTTGTETGLLHLKNTSTTKNLHIYSVRTCADVINKWKIYKNSTGGTLISEANAGSSNNLNVTSSNIADVNCYKGADAKTVSGGTMLEHWINDVGHSTEVFDGALILGRNDSVELSVELASAGDVCCRIIAYYEEA